MAEKHPFLSDEWVAKAQQLRKEFTGGASAGGHSVRVNQVITDVPFGEGTLRAHMDTTSGSVELGVGHVDTADATMMLDYETAKAIFVEGNAQTAMQAFMAGRIRVDGDLTKLTAMIGAMQQQNPDPQVVEFQRRIKEITA